MDFNDLEYDEYGDEFDGDELMENESDIDSDQSYNSSDDEEPEQVKKANDNDESNYIQLDTNDVDIVPKIIKDKKLTGNHALYSGMVINMEKLTKSKRNRYKVTDFDAIIRLLSVAHNDVSKGMIYETPIDNDDTINDSPKVYMDKYINNDIWTESSYVMRSLVSKELPYVRILNGGQLMKVSDISDDDIKDGIYRMYSINKDPKFFSEKFKEFYKGINYDNTL